METASIHNISRAEIFTSRQAIHAEIAVTRMDSRENGRGAVPRRVLQQQIGVMIEAANHAGRGGDVSEQQAPRGHGSHRGGKNHRGVGIQRPR